MTMTRLTFSLPEIMAERIRRAAIRESHARMEAVSIPEYIRRALVARLAQDRNADLYGREDHDHYD